VRGPGGLDIVVSNAARQQTHPSILDISTESAKTPIGRVFELPGQPALAASAEKIFCFVSARENAGITEVEMASPKSIVQQQTSVAAIYTTPVPVNLGRSHNAPPLNSMMPKEHQKKYDWQRNTQQPKQCSTSESHSSPSSKAWSFYPSSRTQCRRTVTAW
jgi:hypothetical protein